MPYLPTAQAFLEQSRLLISARPTTSRISTKYTLPNPDPSPSKYKPKSHLKSKSKISVSAPSTSSPPPESAQAQPLKATLTLKTYDPVSGTCLKYETDKGAEVGRLVAALSNCGRVMAALPDKEGGAMEVDEGVKEEPASKEPDGKGKGPVKEAKTQPPSKAGEKGGGGGGGGKKKKGKR